jgi:hypothetical protein
VEVVCSIYFLLARSAESSDSRSSRVGPLKSKKEVANTGTTTCDERARESLCVANAYTYCVHVNIANVIILHERFALTLLCVSSAASHRRARAGWLRSE